jgi:hypothetical protein
MRCTFIPLMLTALCACTSDHLTNGVDGESPLPPGPGPLAVIQGMIVRDDGACIDSASVRVVQGQSLDRSAAQRTPCDVSTGKGGFVLTDLTPGLPMTIRATAPGYLSLDKTITPTIPPLSLVMFPLQKLIQ